jgi:hypothetical protein
MDAREWYWAAVCSVSEGIGRGHGFASGLMVFIVASMLGILADHFL